MRRIVRAPLVALGILVGCSGATEPTGPPTLQFSDEVLFGVASIPTQVEVSSTEVRFWGLIRVPTTGHTVAGALNATTAGELNVYVTASPTEAGQPFVSQHYYVGRIGHLAHGTYRVRVYHIISGPGSADTTVAYDHDVAYH